MKINRVLLLVSLVIQLALLPSAGSGDDRSVPGEKAPVAIAPNEGEVKEEDMSDTDKLTEEQGKYLLGEARKNIQKAFSGEKEQKIEDTGLPAVFNQRRGTFVTLTIGGNLRGCIGHIIPQESLIEGIRGERHQCRIQRSPIQAS